MFWSFLFVMRIIISLFFLVCFTACQDHNQNKNQSSVQTELNDFLSYQITFCRSNTQGETDVSHYLRIPSDSYFEWRVMLNDSTEQTLTHDNGQESVFLNGVLADTSYQYWGQWFSFFEFMLKIPDGVEVDKNAIKQSKRDTVIGGNKFEFMKVSYAENIGTDVWYYYYQNDEFKFCDFYHDDVLTNGERVVFKGEQNFKQKKLAKSWAWYQLPSLQYMYTDTLKYLIAIGDE